jgi:hypothetical protein
MVATPEPERVERWEFGLSSMLDIGSNLGAIDTCDGDASGSSRAIDVT